MATLIGTSGDDLITPTSVSDGVIASGSTAPTTGADTIDGGAGNDTLAGGLGNDSVIGGLGDDLISWVWRGNYGDGADTIDGGDGVDTLAYTTDIGAFPLKIGALSNGHVAISGFFIQTINVDNVETFAIRVPASGTIQVGDLSTTDVRTINFDFTINGAPDSYGQSVNLLGATGADQGSLTLSDDGVHLQAFIGGVTSNFVLSAADHVTLNGGGGNDTITVSGLRDPVGHILVSGGTGDDLLLGGGNVSLRGDTGDDTLVGSVTGGDSLSGGDGADWLQGAFASETLSGDAGNDLIAGHGGGDVITGGDGDDLIYIDDASGKTVLAVGGADTVDGGAGANTAQLDARFGAGVVAVAASGTHVQASFDGVLAADIVHVQTLDITPAAGFGGAIDLSDLSATDVRTVDIDLSDHSAIPGGQPDFVPETVTLTGATSADQIGVTLGADGASLSVVDTVAGVVETTNIAALDAADQLSFNLGDGDDVITISGPAVAAAIAIDGGLGQDNLSASAGADTLNGGGGDDILAGGAGDDRFTWSLGDGADTVNGGQGSDTAVFAGGADAIVAVNGAVTTVSVDGAAPSQLSAVETIVVESTGGALSVNPGAVFFTSLDLGAQTVLKAGGLTLDAEGFGRIALGGTASGDDFLLNDVSAGSVSEIDVDLGLSTPGTVGDGQQDSVSFFDRQLGPHHVTTALSSSGDLIVAGYHETVVVTHLEAIDDVEFRVRLDDFSDNYFDLSAVNAQVRLFGGSGDDTIIGPANTARAYELDGESGNDSIVGGLGAGQIVGGTGDDTLSSGGAGETIFAFVSGHGHDLVLDFHGNDKVELVHFADQSFTALLSNHHLYQQGADVIVSDGGDTMITLKDLSLSQLTSDNFIFG